MKKNNVRPEAATGTTTAKEMTKKRVKADKWVYIIQYEYSDGSIEQIIDEYPTKEEAQEALSIMACQQTLLSLSMRIMHNCS